MSSLVADTTRKVRGKTSQNRLAYLRGRCMSFIVIVVMDFSICFNHNNFFKSLFFIHSFKFSYTFVNVFSMINFILIIYYSYIRIFHFGVFKTFLYRRFCWCHLLTSSIENLSICSFDFEFLIPFCEQYNLITSIGKILSSLDFFF